MENVNISVVYFAPFSHRKAVIEMIYENTNWCKDEFVDSSKHIENSIRLIDKSNEYTSFISQNK